MVDSDTLVGRFEWDPESGTMVDKTLGARVMTFTAYGWSELKNELDSTFMSGASVIYQRMGYSYGRYVAKVAKQNAAKAKKHLTPKSIFQILADSAKNQGWGKLELNSGDFETGVATVVMRGCIFCAADKKGTVPRCNYLVGLVGGAADEITGLSHRVVEGRCAAKDDGICEIRLERVTAATTS
ncbi:MAG: hypothetical protein HY296_00420 [Thaumarchaeota archaeon]|nr:hypothetical protein [Nitrososphaerota archaeon]